MRSYTSCIQSAYRVQGKLALVRVLKDFKLVEADGQRWQSGNIWLKHGHVSAEMYFVDARGGY